MLPNIISFLRLPLAGALLFFGASVHQVLWGAMPLLVLVAAYATDIADGWLARRWSVASDAGYAIDVGCDRVLHFAAMILLLAVHAVAPMGLVALACRDILISCLRAASPHGVDIARKFRPLSLLHALIVRVWFAAYLSLAPLSHLFNTTFRTQRVDTVLHSLLLIAIGTGYCCVIVTARELLREGRVSSAK